MATITCEHARPLRTCAGREAPRPRTGALATGWTMITTSLFGAVTGGLARARSTAACRFAAATTAAGLLIAVTMFGNGATSAAASTDIYRTTAPASLADGTYTVKSGDTLLGIAIKLGVPDGQQFVWIDSLVALNGLADANEVVVGQVLKLPPIPSGSSGTVSTRVAAASPDTYTVKDGDTLFGIAVKLGISSDQQYDWVASLRSLNSLSESDLISVGQVLSLPAAGSLPTKPSSAPKATPTPEVMPVLPLTYKVKEGDQNLYDLATRFGIPYSMQDAWVTKVVALNRLDANGMYVGNVIKLPQN